MKQMHFLTLLLFSSIQVHSMYNENRNIKDNIKKLQDHTNAHVIPTLTHVISTLENNSNKKDLIFTLKKRFKGIREFAYCKNPLLINFGFKKYYSMKEEDGDELFEYWKKQCKPSLYGTDMLADEDPYDPETDAENDVDEDLQIFLLSILNNPEKATLCRKHIYKKYISHSEAVTNPGRPASKNHTIRAINDICNNTIK